MRDIRTLALLASLGPDALARTDSLDEAQAARAEALRNQEAAAAMFGAKQIEQASESLRARRDKALQDMTRWSEPRRPFMGTRSKPPTNGKKERLRRLKQLARANAGTTFGLVMDEAGEITAEAWDALPTEESR